MWIIEIQANELGGHSNQKGNLTTCPDGWAIIPDDFVVPESFPFVDIEVEDGFVTAMTPREMPEPEPVEPTDAEILDALLGVSENE